jgi:hypothetical protein
MATVKSSCTRCKRHTAHELTKVTGLELPPGISESYCVVCESFKVVITDETLAEPFFTLTPKRSRNANL